MTVRTGVVVPSALAIGGLLAWTLLDADGAARWIASALAWTAGTFGWFYTVAVFGYLVFVVALAASRFGRIRLGPPGSRPEFPLLSWAAMLFAAGIGIDLLFFCVTEPLAHFLEPPRGDGGTVAAARQALQLTFLHWGLSGWGVYTLVGLALGYFGFRRGLPLSVRSALQPLLEDRVRGPLGDAVDVAAVLATVFGLATSLGIGILQVNYALSERFGMPSSTLVQGALALLIVAFAGISAALGVERGIRRLSEFNMLLALAFLVFVLFAGDTLFLVNALVMNVGDYLGNFVTLSLDTYAFDAPVEWQNAWTLFFWAWWIAWGPFVGLFLARISRGRTIRSFVIGTLTLPLAFMMAWMSIIGNSAIDLEIAGFTQIGDAALGNPGAGIYLFLEQLPLPQLTSLVVTLLAIVFFVTSGDSGALVLADLSSSPARDIDAPVRIRLIWAAVVGALAAALLAAGGLQTLQSVVVVMGLPFAIVLVLMAWSLYRALSEETAARAETAPEE